MQSWLRIQKEPFKKNRAELEAFQKNSQYLIVLGNYKIICT